MTLLAALVFAVFGNLVSCYHPHHSVTVWMYTCLPWLLSSAMTWANRAVRQARRPFHLLPQPRMEVFLTDNRGFGVRAAEPIARGTFVVEYAGAPHCIVLSLISCMSMSVLLLQVHVHAP